MPAPSRWMIRCSLLYLLVGFTIGAIILISKAYPAYSWVWMLLSVHIEMLIFGFIIQFTMGTAYWILPRFLKDKSRGNSVLANIMVLSLNLGIIFVVMNTFVSAFVPFRLLGRGFEIIAVIIFIGLHWKRAVTYRNETMQ